MWITTPQRPLPPSPANVKRAMEKLHSIKGHRGLCRSELVPGIRVNPNEYEEKAREILCDGTEEGGEALRRCLAKALGQPWP